MKKNRASVFETNSSSTHSISFDNKVVIASTFEQKATYLLQWLESYSQDWVEGKYTDNSLKETGLYKFIEHLSSIPFTLNLEDLNKEHFNSALNDLHLIRVFGDIRDVVECTDKDIREKVEQFLTDDRYVVTSDFLG